MISLYRQQPSWLHRQRAGFKLSALLLVSLLVFPVKTLAPLGGLAAVLLVLYRALGKGGLAEAKVVIPLWPWFLFICVFHVFEGSYLEGVVVIGKLVLMVLTANLLTLTTRHSDLLSALEVGLSPLGWVGISTRPMALAVSLMLRYVPVLSVLLENNAEAWKARGGGRKGRWRLMVPALIGALRLAEHAGDSLFARGGIRGLGSRH